MTNTRKTVLLLLMLVTLLAAQPVRDNEKKSVFGRDCERLSVELKLTAEQEKKLDELKVKSHKKAIDLQADIQKKQIDKRSAIESEDFTTAKRLVSEIFDIKKELVNQKLAQHEEMLKVLTADQKKQFNQMKKTGHGRMHRHGKFSKKHNGMNLGRSLNDWDE